MPLNHTVIRSGLARPDKAGPCSFKMKIASAGWDSESAHSSSLAKLGGEQDIRGYRVLSRAFLLEVQTIVPLRYLRQRRTPAQIPGQCAGLLRLRRRFFLLRPWCQ